MKFLTCIICFISMALYGHALRHYPDAPLDIITFGHPTLKMIATEVTESEIVSKDFQLFLDKMIKTMKKAGGVGLAAPQVNVSKRLFVMKPSSFKRAEVIINPVLEYLKDYGTKQSTESCLSIPGKSFRVRRYRKLNMRYQDREGHHHHEKASGFRAIVIQHEYDHLNGNLISDLFLKSFHLNENFNFSVPQM